jgi:hypothetical protein
MLYPQKAGNLLESKKCLERDKPVVKIRDAKRFCCEMFDNSMFDKAHMKKQYPSWTDLT